MPAHTHHADLPLAARLAVRVGLVRGLSAHRVLEGVTAQRHALARIVVLVASLLVHEQLVALTGEAGALGRVCLGIGGCLGRGGHLARVRLASFLLVRARRCLLFRFLVNAWCISYPFFFVKKKFYYKLAVSIP